MSVKKRGECLLGQNAEAANPSGYFIDRGGTGARRGVVGAGTHANHTRPVIGE